MHFEREGSGPTVLLFSGLGCDCRMWRPVRNQLSRHFDLLCPHTWGGGGFPERARKVGDLLDRLGVVAVGVAGLSMGGYLALECVRHWPERIRALALLDTTAAADDPSRLAQRRQTLHTIREGRFEEVLQTFLDNVLSPRHGPASEVRQLMLGMARGLGPEVFASDVEAIVHRGSFADVLRMLRVPTLFLAGEEDRLTPPEVARQMSAEVPGSRVHVVPGAGHMAPLESPAPVAEMLQSFFRTALPA